VEFSAFYALSLVSLAEEDVDTTANLKKAISILDPLLQQHPDHPGVAHYLIHATDRPEFAAQGLDAARRYAAIAPDSAHALHMPSHIFVRLGLWQDSITSNIAANASGAHAAEMHLAESHYQTHAMDFLSYSYLQSGQEAKAREVIEHISHVVGATDEAKADHRAYLAARTALELHRWKEAAALPVPAIRKNWQDTTYWARAIGAARSGDIARGEADVKELTQLVADREKRSKKSGYTVSREKATDLREAEAWLAFAKGNPDEALQELRAAADRQDKDGGESVGIPAREMLADMLLELKRPAEALAEYKTVLKNSPNRFDGFLGAARSAQAAGDSGGAQSYYAKLAEICAPGADRPELAESRSYVARQSN
jgi:predicted Zn-dependent protease